MKNLKMTLVITILGILLYLVGSAAATERTIEATVMKNGDNYCLLDDTTEYIVLGKNLKPYVGDTVTVTGDVYNGRDFPTIHVDAIKIVAHKDLITPKLKSERAMS
ncbi:MAG: hypothetical protein P8X96_20465 [Desulfobacteraceae bacterium]